MKTISFRCFKRELKAKPLSAILVFTDSNWIKHIIFSLHLFRVSINYSTFPILSSVHMRFTCQTKWKLIVVWWWFDKKWQTLTMHNIKNNPTTYHNTGSHLLSHWIELWTETHKVKLTATTCHDPLQLGRLLTSTSPHKTSDHAANRLAWAYNVCQISDVKSLLLLSSRNHGSVEPWDVVKTDVVFCVHSSEVLGRQKGGNCASCAQQQTSVFLQTSIKTNSLNEHSQDNVFATA